MPEHCRFIKKSDYEVVCKASASSHDVSEVLIKENKDTTKQGLAKKNGFAKICDLPDEHGISHGQYPALAAKYVVAFSVFARAGLGDKASEDLLVYDEQGNIVETLSLKIPGFVPLSKQPDPELDVLIKGNFASLLVSAYRHKNDDLHPDNVAADAIIDHDMDYYDLMSIIKGKRPLCGIIPSLSEPKEASDLKERDICNLLLDVESRTHWPTHFIPKNLNLAKRFKASAFSELASHPDFNKQFFTAILTELLAYDKTMLENRMRERLGDIALGLEELPEEKRIELLKYGEKSALFYKKNPDGSTTERTFVEHCSRLFEVEQHKFSQLVLKIPEVRDFVMKNPEAYKEIREWFINENKKIADPTQQYNIDAIDQNYRELWHKCFLEQLCTQLSVLNRIKNKTLELYAIGLGQSYIMVEYEEIEKETEKESNALSASIHMTIKKQKWIKLGAKKTPRKKIKLVQSETNAYQKAAGLLNELYDRLVALIIEHYSKDTLSSDDNQDLLLQIRELLHQTKNELKTLDMVITMGYFDRFKTNLCSLLQSFQAKESFSIDFAATLSDTESPLTAKPSTPTSPTFQRQRSFSSHQTASKPLDAKVKDTQTSDDDDDFEFIDESFSNKELIETLSKLLSCWLKTHFTNIDTLLEKASSQYKPRGSASTTSYFNPCYFNPLKYFRGRTKDIETLSAMDKSSFEKSHVALHQFFGQGKWKNTSINTLLLKELCLKLIEYYRDPENALECLTLSSHTINHVHSRVMDKEFDWSWIAEPIASTVFNNKQPALQVRVS